MGNKIAKFKLDSKEMHEAIQVYITKKYGVDVKSTTLGYAYGTYYTDVECYIKEIEPSEEELEEERDLLGFC